jgi:tyrosinase
MRTTAVLTALLPAALTSVIPATEGISPDLSIEKRQDLTVESFGGKILQADVYAGIAGLNQQVYQATQKSSQWKTCNPSNIIIRREW